MSRHADPLIATADSEIRAALVAAKAPEGVLQLLDGLILRASRQAGAADVLTNGVAAGIHGTVPSWLAPMIQEAKSIEEHERSTYERLKRKFGSDSVPASTQHQKD